MQPVSVNHLHLLSLSSLKMSCMKSQGVFLPFVILFYLNGFLCTLTQHITCLASNKQSQTLCFEKKWHFQPHSLLLF